MSLFATRMTSDGRTAIVPVVRMRTSQPAPRDDVGPAIRPPVTSALTSRVRVPSNGGGGNTTATVSTGPSTDAPTSRVPSNGGGGNTNVPPPSDQPPQQSLVSQDQPLPGPDDLLPFPESAPTPTPFYKKWWFWALVAGGTGTGYYLYKKRRG
jgi:hypothetical protein